MGIYPKHCFESTAVIKVSISDCIQQKIWDVITYHFSKHIAGVSNFG